MREKLLKLMESEKLTASRLAELLGIRSSGISHILSERNKPSYDFLQKILRRFPNINPDWLLLDSEQMYRTGDATTSSFSHSLDSVNSTANGELSSDVDNFPFTTDFVESTQQPLSANTSVNSQPESLHSLPFTRRGVKRVIILFEDHTFESYDVR